jgi:predicted DNA binding CopG/RHH family protein
MKTITSTDEAWDKRELGAVAANAEVAGSEHMTALDESLGMQSISIRMPKQLIEHYKLIAHFHDAGYQPLMRDVLQRWVPGALKELFEAQQAQAEKASSNATLVDFVEEPARKAA